MLRNNNASPDNMMLSVLMTVSPLIVCTDTLKKTLVMVYVFSAVTFLTVIISSFLPKNISCTLRILIYAVISSLIYIPVRLSVGGLWHGTVETIGIYCPLLAVNFLTTVKADSVFFSSGKTGMTTVLIRYIAGFDILMVLMALVREFLDYGTVNSILTDFPVNISGFSQSFGGFICLGLFAGLYRRIRGNETDVSDK